MVIAVRPRFFAPCEPPVGGWCTGTEPHEFILIRFVRSPSLESICPFASCCSCCPSAFQPRSEAVVQSVDGHFVNCSPFATFATSRRQRRRRGLDGKGHRTATTVIGLGRGWLGGSLALVLLLLLLLSVDAYLMNDQSWKTNLNRLLIRAHTGNLFLSLEWRFFFPRLVGG